MMSAGGPLGGGLWIRGVARGGTFLVAAAAMAPAQAPDTTLLRPGNRVRVWLLPDQPTDPNTRVRYEGRLVALRSDTLILQLHRRVPAVAVPRIWLEDLQVSAGQRSRALGAWRGARAAPRPARRRTAAQLREAVEEFG